LQRADLSSDRAGGEGPAPRRTFIEVSEVPGLIRGALCGEARALRRILGGRRAGRYGALLLAAAALVAAPIESLPALALAFVAFGGAAWAGQRREPKLRLREALRAGLWTGAPLVAAALPLRLLWPDTPLPALLALALGYALLLRGLGRGLGHGLG
jgi:hypothetical protein